MKNERAVEEDRLTFEGLLNVNGFLGTGFEVRDVALGLAERHGAFRGNHSLALLNIDLVTNNDLYHCQP